MMIETRYVPHNVGV